MVNILCYKSKTLANGEHPLMLCVTKDRKRKYKSLGISVNPKFWDFELIYSVFIFFHVEIAQSLSASSSK
ncbi:hypothetical protein D0T56_01930 [Dysgonomonas sp. 520]|nr:hypothetical protein [Dysgonomonas sp. 520]